MKKNRFIATLILLVVFPIVVLGLVEGQERKDTPPVDPFAADLKRNEIYAAEIIGQVKSQKDPLVRFMKYLEKVININKRMLNGSNLPETLSTFADDPKSPQDQEKLLAQLAKNREAIETFNGDLTLKQSAIVEMRAELDQIDPKFRSICNSIIEALK